MMMRIFLCFALLLGTYWSGNNQVMAESRTSVNNKDKVIEEDTCSFNDEELAPPRTFQRSPHDISDYYIWPNGEIPYVFTNGVDQGDRKLFEANMRKIEKNSCFRFKKQIKNQPPTDRKYLEIDIPIWANSCADLNSRGSRHRFSAHVSNKYLIQRPVRKNALLLKSQHKLTDKKVCEGMEMYEGGILHEMFHTLGVGHTQRRADRDNYITVYSGNTQDPKQYAVCKNCKVYSDLPYECNSIMHYGYMTLAKRSDERYPTMQAKNPSSCKIGKNPPHVPTRNDWKLIKKIGNTVCGSGGSISSYVYTEVVNACLNGHNGQTIPDVSLEECKEKCSSSTELECNSLEYLDTPNKWNRKYCYLSKETKDTKPWDFKKPCPGNYVNAIYLEKKSSG